MSADQDASRLPMRLRPDRTLADFLIAADATLSDAMRVIEGGAQGVAVLVDEQRKLRGVLTDGDLRRALLSDPQLDRPAAEIMLRADKPAPISAAADTSDAALLDLMRAQAIRHVPLLDGDGRVVDIAFLDLIVRDWPPLDVSGVVMAGGFGQRLRPLTQNIPKPMLQVGDRPLMHRIIDQMHSAGIRNICVSTHYHADKIKSYFNDGADFGVRLDYVTEEQPLGTAGALALMDHAPDRPILVINGDVLTKARFGSMVDFHRDHAAAMTVAVRRYDVAVPYGTVECDGPNITGLREKPTFSMLINAGLYLLEPWVCDRIPRNRRFDMTDLIEQLLAEKKSVVSYFIHEYWLDIGKLEDYEKAQNDYTKDGNGE